MRRMKKYLLMALTTLLLLTPVLQALDESTITRAWVVAHRENWDRDAEDDGIRVWAELQDKNEDMIEYTDIEMPVEIKIYTTESRTLPEKPARLIYSGSSVMKNSREDGFISGAMGIKDISWEEMATLPTDQEYGLMYITITLPSGENCSARDDEAQIKLYEDHTN